MAIADQLLTVFRTSARGLEAQRVAMGTATENIANATTSRTADGGPYQPKRVLQEGPDQQRQRFASVLSKMQTRMTSSDPMHLEGPSLRRQLEQAELGPIVEIEAEARERLEYDPAHPHADQNGYVHYPDVNVVEEMARMMSANRVYEANLSALKAAKEMIKRTLEI